MKKILLKYLNLYVLSGLLLVGFAGCSDDKDNDPVNPGPDVEELPSIGTYSFRGEANRIVSGEATIDGGYFTCIFSPEKIQDGKTSTYFFVFSGYVLGGASGGCIDLVPKRPVFLYLRRSVLLLFPI